jgi:hypothetical protein
MTSRFFEFGQTLPEYPVPVLNERAVRASAGILFVFAFAAFAQALLLGNFHATQVFVVAFIIEFAIRLFVNPRWAPAMIVGQWVVRGQVPEYVGAPQKRFAWSIGLGLGLWMFYLIVIERVIGPINMLVCGTCLLLMFFESAFGICIGCKLYNWLRPAQAQLCPGGACAYTPPAGSGGHVGHALLLVLFIGVIVGANHFVAQGPSLRGMHHPSVQGHSDTQAPSSAEEERCRVPAFAKAMGHETIWKQHNGCL